MRAALKFCLILNLSLGLILAWLGGRRPPHDERVGTEAQPRRVQRLHNEAEGQPGRALAKPGRQGFRWESLESADYPTYVANLRAIGCTEQTIRDIITADVKSLFGHKREELTRLLAAADSNYADQLRTRLQELPADENATLSELLRPNDAASPNSTPARSADSQPPWKRARQRAPALLPLALQGADLGYTALSLNQQQLDAVKELGAQFNQKMLSSGLAPDDPAYRELWKKTQVETDELMFAHLGFENYVNYELAIRRAKE